jgi:hypothetical protein
MNSPHKAGAGAAVPATSTSVSASASAAAPHQPLTRRIRLVKRHIHAGLPKGPGEEIELLHDLADWLVAEGAAQELEPAAVATPTASIHPTTTATTTTKKDK